MAGQLARLLEALAAEPDPHTSISDESAALDAHVADGLSGLEVEALRAARRIADVGAGAGFPGLVLAIALPEASVDLIESARRRNRLKRDLPDVLAPLPRPGRRATPPG